MVAAGWQEVVIQHWRHNVCQAVMTESEVRALWHTLRRRSRVNEGRSKVRYVQILENHGPRSGASLPHPHAQVLALPFVPPDAAVTVARSRSYYEKHGRCVFDDIVAAARATGRVLSETRNYVAIVPPAMERGDEIWVLPVAGDAAAARFSEALFVDQVADLVRHSLKLLYLDRDDPDYNVMVRTFPRGAAPGSVSGAAPREWFRWYVQIIPHNPLSSWAGIKGYGGFCPVAGTPEEIADRLRVHTNTPAPVAVGRDCRGKRAAPSSASRTALACVAVAGMGLAWLSARLRCKAQLPHGTAHSV